MCPDPYDLSAGAPAGADLLTWLTSQLGNTVRVDRELGGGGMSRVFLATDLALDRRVVVKLVSAAGGAPSLERFRREILLAAALHHPHIVPILATGEAGAVPWYSMPYIEGRSLRDRLAQEGPLPVRDILRILRDAARACAYAHEHGVVHRDLKPENILLAGDGAMIIDFGIAKALSEGHGPGASQPGVTRAGFTLGTPTYMAPEQAAADPGLDHRADLYSLGVVAFELAAGRPPFRGATSHEVLRAHLADPVPPLAALRPEIPPGLAELVTECLAKAPGERPQSAAEIVERLEGLIGESTSGSRRSIGRATRLSRAILAVALITLGAFLAGRVLVADHPRVPAASVAVLPFVPRGDDTASQWLASGLSDDLSAQLEGVQGLHVAARLSVDRLGRAPLPPSQLAETLGVRALLDGVVRREGSSLRVIAQLVEASSGKVLWTGTFSTTPDSTADVIRAVLREVRAVLLPEARAVQGAPAPHHDPQAYADYLRGRALLRGRSADAVTAAVDAFRSALAQDSTLAVAATGLADALLLEPLYTGAATTSVLDPAEQALQWALHLQPGMVEALLSRAQLRRTRWEWGGAVSDLDTVLAHGVNSGAHQALGEVLLLEGRPDSAFAEFERTRQIDPGNALAAALAGVAAALDGEREVAALRTRAAVSADSLEAPVRLLAGTAFLYLRDPTRALPELRAAVSLAPSQPLFRGILAQGLAMAGDSAEARAQHELLLGASGGGVAGALVHANLALGRIPEALDALERAVRERDPMLTSEPLDSPLFEAVRHQPRFRAVQRAIGLVPGGVSEARSSRAPAR